MKLFDEEKGPQKKPEMPDKNKNKGKNSKTGGDKSFFSNILSVILIFLIIATLYSVFVENKKEIEEITISQLAQDVIAGEVIKITVEGDKLKIEYAAEKETGETESIVKRSKKEVEASFSETLADHGVTQEQLMKANIDIKNPSGLEYWLTNFMPFLIPVLLPVFFFLVISMIVRFLYKKIRHIYRRT
ncbi:MAG: hypothetical protein KAJ14_03545 [Candidatus Omnitrophica bacterium]|nr:hypothetical protein [Candidatus Omnitrophota bacterium]